MERQTAPIRGDTLPDALDTGLSWSCTRCRWWKRGTRPNGLKQVSADVRRQTPSHDPQDTGGRFDVLACHTPPARTRDKKCTSWACDVAASVRSNVIVRSTGADTCANAATPLRRGGTVYLSMCVVACFVSWFFFGFLSTQYRSTVFLFLISGEIFGSHPHGMAGLDCTGDLHR